MGLVIMQSITSPNPSGRPPSPIIDIDKAIRLHCVNGLSYEQIAKQMDCTRQAVHQKIQRFKQILIPDDELNHWRENRVKLKDTAELSLFLAMNDPKKIEAASLNNIAYAYKQIHETRRLDEGLSTSNIDLHAEYESLRTLQDAKLRLQSVCLSDNTNDINKL
jgi:predicted DNA-binding protein YlxM (UPF0122 family)